LSISKIKENVMNTIDWFQLNKEYEDSGVTLREFCQAKNINFGSMRHKRSQIRKRQKDGFIDSSNSTITTNHFKEYSVGTQIQIIIEDDGRISVHGLTPDCLPLILSGLYAVQKSS